MKKSKKNKTYVDLLLEDHKRLKALFKKFENTGNSSEKKTIAETVLRELKVHMTIEEEIVYPALREVVEEDAMDEADVEHHVAKILMSELSRMKSSDDHYGARVTVLGEIIKRHIEEEEGDIFPQAKKTDVEEITGRFLERKQVLMQ